MKYPGTSGDDDFTGTSGNDVFYMGQGGNDTVDGGGGNDIFSFGGSFNINDKVDGGAGTDTLILNGDYSAGLVVGPTALVNVERINLAAGHSYALTFTDGVIASGQTLIVDASSLGAGVGEGANISAYNVTGTDTRIVVNAGAATTFFDGGAGANILNGGTGQNIVNLQRGFDSNDRLNGGSGGSNFLHLTGDYSAGLTITGAMLHNFQFLTFFGADDFRVSTADAVVAAGKTLNVNASSVAAGHHLIFNGAHEIDGKFSFTDSAGDDTLIGGAQADFFNMPGGGIDHLSGGGGDDRFGMENQLDAADRIDGGAGTDELDLSGDYSAGLSFKSTTMVNVETLYLNPGGSYRLIMNDGTVAAGQNLQILGGNLDAAHMLYADASKETNGTYFLEGGDGDDTLIGGQAGNIFVGGLGQDHLIAGAGADVFTYTSGPVDTSTSVDRDIITGFNALHDSFDMQYAVSGVDAAVTAGNLSTSHFDAQLAHFIGTGQLHVGDAVLYTPDGGNLQGHTFLVVDANGAAGYQAGQDYVFQLESATHLASLSTSNFT
ncbi:MAG TPA: hypothetical protein VGG69_01860 [Rhizomicrobium sp.]